jgi:ABC-2 type transport system permease protein
MSAVPAVPPAVSAEAAAVPAAGAVSGAGPSSSLSLLLVPPRPRTGWQLIPARVLAMCIVELQKLRHDRTELYTRAVQPALWLLIFGETFTRIHAIPTGGVPYLDFLAPGIIAQSAMFIAIFYGIQIIWERDAGVLTKLLVTPTPRTALVTGKAFAAGVKSVIQALVVIVFAAILGVGMTWNPLKLLGVLLVVVLGGAFFSCLSVTIAGIVRTRDRLMGIGQAMPCT